MSAPDSPIAVLATGFAGRAVCDAILRALPREDVLLLADHAYAPYARRRPAVVADRVTRLAGDLVSERDPKALVLASAQACADVLEPLRVRLARLPVIGIDGIVSQAAARSATGRVALLTGDDCLRGAQLARSLKRQRGGGLVTWVAVPGLRAALECGSEPTAAIEAAVAHARAAGVDAIALGCPHAGALALTVKRAAGEDVAVVDCATLAAERVRRLLLRGALTTTRRRPGRVELASSDPAAGQRALRRSGRAGVAW